MRIEMRKMIEFKGIVVKSFYWKLLKHLQWKTASNLKWVQTSHRPWSIPGLFIRRQRICSTEGGFWFFTKERLWFHTSGGAFWSHVDINGPMVCFDFVSTFATMNEYSKRNDRDEEQQHDQNYGNRFARHFRHIYTHMNRDVSVTLCFLVSCKQRQQV